MLSHYIWRYEIKMTADYELMVDNLVEYYRFERATKIDTEVIVPSTKFCLELVLQQDGRLLNNEIVAIAQKRLAELEYETFSNFCFVRR